MTELITQANETNNYIKKDRWYYKKDHWYYIKVNSRNIVEILVDLTYWFGSGNEPKDINDERLKMYISYKPYEESKELL